MIKSLLIKIIKNSSAFLQLFLKQVLLVLREKINKGFFKDKNKRSKAIRQALIKKVVYLSLLYGVSLCPVLAGVQNYGDKEKKMHPSQHSNIWVRKAEDFLNGIQYLKTSFVQNNPDGSQAEGVFYLSRPDKMRIEYKTPQKLIILSDGQYIFQYDPVLDETSKADLELTPAAILLNEKINFSGVIQVLEVKEEDNKVYIQVSKVGAEDLGTFTFCFQKTPFDLKGWTVLDQQGQTIIVELSERKEYPKTLDYSLFRFHRKKD